MAISIAKIPDSIFREYSNKNAEILEEAILNGILLPDDATNGDVINALFSKDIADVIKNRMISDWWNEPYKEVWNADSN